MTPLWNRLAALAIAWAAIMGLPARAAEPVSLQPPGGPDVTAFLNRPADDPAVPAQTLQALLQQKIKYVFVIFNENRSFDSVFGTFPGVNGLYSDGRHARTAPGSNQSYTDTAGNRVTVAPFRIGPAQNANVVDSVDHSHPGLARKIHVVDGVAQMDGFAADEYARQAPAGATAAQQAKARQYARLVMAHVDCDTVPFFWRWASNFTVFDNIFATEDTPSTPNAIAMIAGQAGETQWVKHPGPAASPATTGTSGPVAGTFVQGARSVTFSGTDTTQGPPLVNDPQPYYGSEFDPTIAGPAGARQPYGPNEDYRRGNIASNLTFATVPLTLMGNSVAAAMGRDRNPERDLADIRQDIPYIQALNQPPVAWRWYQDGYGPESTDAPGKASHAAYVSHHDGPQYFGYLADNPAASDHLQGESQFFADIAAKSLPGGGVFYIRGGYVNQMGLSPYTHPDTPPAEAAAVAAAKSGDDDHPAYSDHYLSEAMAARVINAIAADPLLWSRSAIVITYDESDGFFDHVPPRILAYGPDGLPLSRGVRVPLLLISPYARTHAVSHIEGDHNAVIQTINAIFGLPALASLPDESQALAAGDAPYFNQFGPQGFHQKWLGPRDLPSDISGSLVSGFDPKRLLGVSPPLPASYALTEAALLTHLPHYEGRGCQALGITPVAPDSDREVPPGFNALPSTYPAAN